MGDSRMLLNPSRRSLDQQNLDRAIGELRSARQPLLDKIQQTGDMPTWFDEALTGVPAKVKVWYNSGPMAPLAPNEDRGYYRDKEDSLFEKQKQERLKLFQRMQQEEERGRAPIAPQSSWTFLK